MKNQGHFVPSDLKKTWEKWLLPLKCDEVGCVITYPGADYPRRVLQMSNYSESKIKIGDYRVERWVSAEEMRKWIGKNNTLVIMGLETILGESRVDLIKALKILHMSGTAILFFAESNILDSEYDSVRKQLIGWQPRVTYFSAYEHEDSANFIKYLLDKWFFTIEKEKIGEIVDECGGILAFIKERVWQEKTDLIDDSQLNWHLKSMWDALTDADRDYLSRLIYGREINNVSLVTKQYMEKISWVVNGELRIPLLREYIRSNVADPRALRMISDAVVINGHDYSAYFSKLQKLILRKLLNSRGNIISRDELMSETWGQEGVSDWAFDSQIKRLRERLDELGVGAKHLVTRRGRGIGWQE